MSKWHTIINKCKYLLGMEYSNAKCHFCQCEVAFDEFHCEKNECKKQMLGYIADQKREEFEDQCWADSEQNDRGIGDFTSASKFWQ